MFLLTALVSRYHYVIVTSLAWLFIHVTCSSSKALSANSDDVISVPASGSSFDGIFKTLFEEIKRNETNDIGPYVKRSLSTIPLIRKTTVPATTLSWQQTTVSTLTSAVASETPGVIVKKSKEQSKDEMKMQLNHSHDMTAYDGQLEINTSDLQRGDVSGGSNHLGYTIRDGQETDNNEVMSLPQAWFADDMNVESSNLDDQFGVPSYVPLDNIPIFAYQPEPINSMETRIQQYTHHFPRDPFDPMDSNPYASNTENVKWLSAISDRTESTSNTDRSASNSSTTINSTVTSSDDGISEEQRLPGATYIDDVITGNDTANGVDDLQEEVGSGIEARQGSEYYENYEYQTTGGQSGANDDEDHVTERVKVKKSRKGKPKKVVKNKTKKPVEPVGQVQTTHTGGQRAKRPPKQSKRRTSNVKPVRSSLSAVSSQPASPLQHSSPPTGGIFSGDQQLLQQFQQPQHHQQSQQQQQQQQPSSLHQQHHLRPSAQANQQLLEGLTPSDETQPVLLNDGSFLNNGPPSQQQFQFIDTSGALITGLIAPSSLGGQFPVVRHGGSNFFGDDGNLQNRPQNFNSQGHFQLPFSREADQNFGFQGKGVGLPGDTSLFNQQQQFGAPGDNLIHTNDDFRESDGHHQFASGDADFSPPQIRFGAPTGDGGLLVRESGDDGTRDRAAPTAVAGDVAEERNGRKGRRQVSSVDYSENEAESENEAGQETNTGPVRSTRTSKKRRRSSNASGTTTDDGVNPASRQVSSDDNAVNVEDDIESESFPDGPQDWSQIKTGFEEDSEEQTNSGAEVSDEDAKNESTDDDADGEDEADKKSKKKSAKKKPVAATTPYTIRPPTVVSTAPVASTSQRKQPAVALPSNSELTAATPVSVVDAVVSQSTQTQSSANRTTASIPATTPSVVFPVSNSVARTVATVTSSIVFETPKPSSTSDQQKIDAAVTAVTHRSSGQVTKTTTPAMIVGLM